MESGFSLAPAFDVFESKGIECSGLKSEFELVHVGSLDGIWIGLQEFDGATIVHGGREFVGAGFKRFDKSGPSGGKSILGDIRRRWLLAPVEVHDRIDSRENGASLMLLVFVEFSNQSSRKACGKCLLKTVELRVEGGCASLDLGEFFSNEIDFSRKGFGGFQIYRATPNSINRFSRSPSMAGMLFSSNNAKSSACPAATTCLIRVPFRADPNSGGSLENED